MRWLSSLALIMVLFGIYDVFFAAEELKQLDVFEFQMGALMAICILSSFLVMKYGKIVNDDNKLRLQFNEENDERFRAIRMKAGIPMVPVLSVLTLTAGIIAGYFNVTVFYTLVIAAVCQVLISGAVKLLYMKRW